ncbi:low affinity immunoglobulin epsilon Fc receptor-like [Drosophila nasuta]|uniref:low affinity immunoglobulin epsilon Fc receptor-like n=1 Tax=Drosophila nasuta TaxID=42062 RepID=UPI00295F1BA7|nr:low affinity immunoglobulin epsilon Fc receptor-like [Drosophila nasuta]
MILTFEGILILTLWHSFDNVQGIVVGAPAPCDAYCFKDLKPLHNNIATLNHRLSECETMQSVNVSARLEKIDKELKTQKFRVSANTQGISRNRKNLSDQMKSIEKPKRELRKPFVQIGSGYYYIEGELKLSWFSAVHACLRHGGHLITLNNQEELDAIIPKLYAKGTYWTDVNNLSFSQYVSMTTGSGAEFLNWRKGEPNGGAKEECTGIEGPTFEMNDFNCYTKNYFICEAFEE